MAEQQDQPPEMPDTKAAEAQPLGEAAEQEPASREEQDRREEGRVPIHYKTEIRSLGDAYPAIVRDLSRWGLMAESDAPFAVRSYVYVVFPASAHSGTSHLDERGKVRPQSSGADHRLSF
jgi:hypothetical protein